MYISIISSEFFSFSKEELFYKLPKELIEKVRIWNIVKIPFWKKEITWLISWIYEKVENIDEEKIKEVKEILSEDFSLEKKHVELIKEISEYYFSPITHSAQLFLAKNVFRPNQTDIKRIERNKNKEKKESTGINEKWLKELNQEQKKVIDFLEKEKRILLHWITWSWKTEVYKHAIFQEIKKWNQACLTVPEIALTPQLLNYFKEVFPEDMLAIIHSKITPVQKTNIWHWVRNWEIKLVIWSRSSLFMPWKNLWIICIDEEHEWTYKNEQSPRYRLNKASEIITQKFWNKLILWSATPDFWDYYRYKKQNKIIEIKERTNKKPLPKIEIVDLKHELVKKNKTFISEKLKFEIENAIKKWEQVILFLNQRWAASSVVCNDCWEVIKCEMCDVSMTYHRRWNIWKLICHYCWKVEEIPEKCPRCESMNIKTIWIWTQKIELEIRKLFPKQNIYRADSDTTKSRLDFEELNHALKNKKIDILIWTQMIAKWFDLPNVSLVWVILADIWLNLPDYKSWERTFQLLTQVAGRAWRWEKNAKILVQTFNPKHPVIEYVKNYDYKKLYEEEIESREILKLPPFSESLKFSTRNKNINFLQENVKEFVKYLQDLKKEKKIDLIVRNAPNYIPKIANEYIWNIVVRWDIDRLMDCFDYWRFAFFRIDRDPNQLS